MINKAQFSIIGRIGSISSLENVTHLSIASDRRSKDKDGSSSTYTDWNPVKVISKKLRKYLENPNVSRLGNLIIIEGSVQTSSYMKDGEKIYATGLIAQDIEILSFAKREEG